jgi:hypothetical protein
VPALIEQFFEKIPLVDLMVRKMPHLVFGTSIFIVLILLLIYSGIKNKDHRYRFLLLWLFCTTLILIPVYLKTRYLYHTAVPFWGMMVYLIALFLHYLKKFWTNLNLRVAGTVFFILMMASNVYLNRQREIMWENIGKFCYFRMERLLDRIGNPSQIIKIYYLKPVGMTERTFLMESKDFTNYLRVYYDDPAISYEGFSSSAELDKLNLSPGEYILTMEGKEKVKDFVPIIR